MSERVAVVTGAASGIGLATAEHFARSGSAVVMVDRDESSLDESMTGLSDQGLSVSPYLADVTVASDVQEMIDSTLRRFGRLDYAFNNAGIEQPHAFVEDISEEAFDRVVEVNLKGVWLCMKYELSVMKAAGRGAIVNTASVGGLVGVRAVGAYNAAKHGVVGLTKAAALECAEAGVRVNAVCPGTIKTGLVERRIEDDPSFASTYAALHPANRLGEPGEVAAAVRWLCSDEASFVTGHAMAVDGGWLAQ